MAGFVVSAKLTANVDGFMAGMRKAKASVDDLTKATAPKKGDAFEKLSDKAALAGVGIAGAMGLAIKRFADFDQSMSAVAANSGATGQELENLRGLAVKLGADSQFSAKEAADGINEMAKAGVSAQDVMGGGLKGALDLAAAGQIGVADAAETAATAMTQFKLQGDAVPHIADLLANAANKAQGGVGDMAQALKQAGLVASSTGLSIEETTAGLTAFASAGLIGSDAGTSFKTMLQRLSAPTDEAAGQMKELGISAYDQQGQFVGLANVAGQLQSAMKELTPEQRNSAMATIFGSDAVRAANVLYAEGADGINKWTDAVSEQGAAAKQAATLTDNLKGDLERMGGALDSVFIQSGSGANDGLRTLVQGMTGLIDTVGKIPGPLLLAGGALTSVALVIPKAIKVAREYKADLDALGFSVEGLTEKFPKMAGALNTALGGSEEDIASLGEALGHVGEAIGIATAGVALLSAGLEKLGYGVNAIDLDPLISDLKASRDGMDRLNESLATASAGDAWLEAADSVGNFRDVLQKTFDPSTFDKVNSFADGFNNLFGVDPQSGPKIAAQRLEEIDSALSQLVSGGNGKAAERLFAQMGAEALSQGVSLDELRAKFPAYAKAVEDAAGKSVTADKALAGMGKTAGDAAAQMTAVTAEGNAAASAILLMGDNADEASDAVKDMAKVIKADMEGASRAFQSSFDVLGKYDPQQAADKAKAAAEKVASAEQKLADLQARIGSKGSLTVAQQQQLSKARDAAADRTVKSAKKAGDAQQRLSDLEARLSAKGSATVSEQQQLRKAREALAKARTEAEAAKKQVGASGLTAMYEQAVSDARKFAANIAEATKRGLDPDTVAKLLQEGPEKAAPALETLLGKNSKNLIKMSNDAETELRKINGLVVEQSRLTSMAVNANNDQMGRDLSTAMAIAQTKAAQGGTATADELAKKLRAKKPEIERIAAEFGIALQIPAPKPLRVTVDVEESIRRIKDVRQELANLNGARALTYIETRIADERDRRQDAANSKDVIRRAQGGIIPGYSPTATADNITMRATAGEYVLRKAAVDSIGKATLDYLNRHGRLPAYATGGLVGARAQQVPMMLAPSRSSAPDSLGRQFVTGSLDMGNGLTGFVRAIVADEMSGARRSRSLREM